MASPVRIEWTVPKRLAVAAFALGALAMAGNPIRGHHVSIDTQELATITAGNLDRIAPVDLADRLVRGATDLRLVDLREKAAFANYHIPGAIHVPVSALNDAGFARNETIVLYSEGDARAAQAWMLLAAQGYRGVRMLTGGIEAWRDQVVFPAIPANATAADSLRFERTLQLARHFGGHAREASGDAGANLASMTIAAPLAAPAPVMATPVANGGGKKTKEGC